MSQRPPIRRDRALAILGECSGDHIWSVEHCRLRRVPEAWIEELADAFESGFFDDRQTIYVGECQTNQYEGVRDLDLAVRAGESLGVDVERACSVSLSRAGLVQSIKRAVMEGD